MNPIAQIIEDGRRALVSGAVPWSTDILGWKLIVPFILVVGTLLVGAWTFRRLSRRFGERL
jgi:ABC-type polysaccharide/polyol phosphate export permease